MKVNFSTDKGYIFLFCSPRPYDQCKYYTNFKITGKLNTKDRCSKNSTPFYDKVNQYLDRLEKLASDYVVNRRLEMISTSSTELTEYLNSLLNPSVDVDKEYTFKSFISVFLEHKAVTSDTKRSYKSKLNSILKIYPTINWKDITSKWRIESENKFLEVPYSPNNVNKIYEVLKDYLNTAKEYGIIDHNLQNKKNWPSKKEIVYNIYLNEEQIDQLYNHDYKSKHHLRDAVNMFVLGCDTGQRYQSYAVLDKSLIVHTNDQVLLRIVHKKTNVRASIPTTGRIMKLLSTKKLTLKHLNDSIKLAAKEAGLDKWEQISSHTARRSYATNRFLEGVPIPYIMSVTGHKTEREFRNYIKSDDLEIAIKLSNFSFK